MEGLECILEWKQEELCEIQESDMLPFHCVIPTHLQQLWNPWKRGAR